MAAPNELSFLPDDYLERKARRRTNVICAVLFALVIAGVASAFFVAERGARLLIVQHDAVTLQYNEAAARIEKARELQTRQRTMARQAELAGSLLERVPRSVLLAELTNSLPAGASLLEFTFDSKPKAPAGPDVSGKTAYELKKAELEAKRNTSPDNGSSEVKRFDVFMKLVGVAPSDQQVGQYLSKLNKSPLFKEVNLVVSEEMADKQRKMRRFQVEMMLEGDAEVKPEIVQQIRTAAAERESR